MTDSERQPPPQPPSVPPPSDPPSPRPWRTEGVPTGPPAKPRQAGPVGHCGLSGI